MRHQLQTVASAARSGPVKYASMVSNVVDIPKPQEGFRDEIDNTRETPFVPKLKEKPNAITPLDLAPVGVVWCERGVARPERLSQCPRYLELFCALRNGCECEHILQYQREHRSMSTADLDAVDLDGDGAGGDSRGRISSGLWVARLPLPPPLRGRDQGVPLHAGTGGFICYRCCEKCGVCSSLILRVCVCGCVCFVFLAVFLHEVFVDVLYQEVNAQLMDIPSRLTTTTAVLFPYT